MPRAQITPQPVEEEFDTSQLEKGILKNGKVVSLKKKGVAHKDPLANRTAVFERKTHEQRTAGYKHYVAPGMKRVKQDRKVIPALPFVTEPADEQYGFPLGKFPQHKHCHHKWVLREREKEIRVDYNVDEIDMEYLTRLNAKRCEKKQDLINLQTLEYWMDRLEKHCQFKPKMIHRMRDENGKLIDDVCNVCLEADSTNCNQIVYCELCCIAFHQDCYGIPYLPEAGITCRRCGISPGKLVRCVLCPSQKGVFKQMQNGKWVHVLCVIWVDETHFGNTIFMECVQNVEKALHDRRALSCQLCKNKIDAKMGACIQCSETKCTASFHVTCARNAGLVMRIEETDDGHVNRFVWCMKHTPEETPEDLERKERMIRNARRENERPLPTISMPTVSLKAIATIQAENPKLTPEDVRELVAYWYLKRQHRFGAPLLKRFTQCPRKHGDAAISAFSPKIADIQKQMALFKKDLNSSMTLADLVLRREEKKRQLMNSSLRMFERGFKPTQTLLEEVLDAMVERDTQMVFTQPVDIAGYLDEIEHPMCLKTMRASLKAGNYSGIDDLRRDVELMCRNCKQFNSNNAYFKSYGRNFGKYATRILNVAAEEDRERNELKNDSTFMTQLLNGMMGEYTGWANKKSIEAPKMISPKKVTVIELEDTPESSQPPPKRRKRMLSPTPKLEPELKVEDMDTDDHQPPPSATTPRRPSSRRRGGQDRKDDEDGQKPPTFHYGTRSATGPSTSAAAVEASPQSQEPKWFGSSAAQTLRRQVETFGANVTPKSSKTGPSTSNTPSSSLRQTTLTNFFCSVPKAEQKTFADIAAASKPSSHRSLFDASSSFKTTRSSSRASAAAASATPVISATMRTSFRMTSSDLKSPLPVPKKVGVKALLTDDEDDELVIAPAVPEMTEAELEEERLRIAENEANSKYAHNQLVIVDGRAAKVIQEQFAHLGDIHRIQRQSMMKKRREVLGELQQQPQIYVEFFQKSSNLENFKWVEPEDIELLDVTKSPKVVGLRAAKEWYNRVMNGEDV